MHAASGLQEAPAIVESHYDVRIVGCSGGIGGKNSGLESHSFIKRVSSIINRGDIVVLIINSY